MQNHSLSLAWRLGKRYWEPENLEVAQTLNLLGVIYQDEDKYAQAEPLIDTGINNQREDIRPRRPKGGRKP